jgi:hypothetical protein
MRRYLGGGPAIGMECQTPSLRCPWPGIGTGPVPWTAGRTTEEKSAQWLTGLSFAAHASTTSRMSRLTSRATP